MLFVFLNSLWFCDIVFCLFISHLVMSVQRIHVPTGWIVHPRVNHECRLIVFQIFLAHFSNIFALSKVTSAINISGSKNKGACWPDVVAEAVFRTVGFRAFLVPHRWFDVFLLLVPCVGTVTN